MYIARMQLPLIEFRNALISPDGKYRYWLERRWSGADFRSPMIVWCMLNPSTADARIDDPTIRRCIGFTNAWGYARLVVVNLYAYRATNPRELEGLNAAELQGPENADWLYYWTIIPSSCMVVCAWGGNRFKCVPYPPALTSMRTYCLGITATREPKHPLYLPASTRLQEIVPT